MHCKSLNDRQRRGLLSSRPWSFSIALYAEAFLQGRKRSQQFCSWLAGCPVPIKIFVFSYKCSQTEISLLHFPLQRKMKLGMLSPLALLSLGEMAVLKQLERRNTLLQQRNQSRPAAWSVFEIVREKGLSRSSSLLLFICFAAAPRGSTWDQGSVVLGTVHTHGKRHCLP